MKIIDAQTNLGKNVFGPDSDIETYLKHAPKHGIIKSIIIPTGTHELALSDGSIEKSCIWSKENNSIIYKRILEKNGEITEQINPINPYENMNNACLKTVKDINVSQQKIKFYFAPKIHPELDRANFITKYLDEKEVVAFKIQSLSSYTTPETIPSQLIETLRDSGVPLIVHTDYRHKYQNDTVSDLINKNTARKWAKWSMKNDVKTCLAHGLRLEKDAVKMINENDLFLVGIGPDYMLNEEKNSLFIRDQNYLDCLFEMVDTNKLSFNYDYRWNAFKRNEWHNLDWESPTRITQYAEKYGLNKQFLHAVFYENSERFFRLGD